MGEEQSAPQVDTDHRQEVVVGLVTAPGLPQELAENLVRRMTPAMEDRHPDLAWKFVTQSEPLAGAAALDVDFVQLTRQRMTEAGWHFGICLTDVPLRVGRRPVTAYVAASLGVGVVSVSALGAIELEERAAQAALRVAEELVDGRSQHIPGERPLGLHRIRELSSPVGLPDSKGDGAVRFITATPIGNLRILLGMVRSNRPWRFIVGLSSALVAALGTGVFAVTSPPVWRIGGAMNWPRLSLLALVAIAAIVITLIAAHGLWEKPRAPSARGRTMMINTATTITVVLGIVTLFVALLVSTMVFVTAVILPSVLAQELHRPPGFEDYVSIAWLVSSIATVGGALGATLESDVAVREAAYGYRAAEPRQ